MTDSTPPLRCDVCDHCLCYCNSTAEGIFQNDNIDTVREKIQDIRVREEFLRGLRLKLESYLNEQAHNIDLDSMR